MRTQAVLITFAMFGFILDACEAKDPEIVGTWTNRDRQVLTVRSDLTGRVSQLTRCAPPLAVTVRRDAYDGFTIHFDENQLVYFPPVQLDLFGGAEFFCSSKSSVPMCAFCRVDESAMECSSTDQKIAATGGAVTHDCSWERVPASLTSTATSTNTSSTACPAVPDGGLGCRAASPSDAGRDRTDAGTGSDAGT